MSVLSPVLPIKTGRSPWRDDFPILRTTMNGAPLCYLDSAASAQKPQAMIGTMNDVMARGYANVHRGLYRLSSELTAQFEYVRGKVARFIGAGDANEIVFTRNATEGINLVAQAWGWAHVMPGDEIIISGLEHHANIVPWQMLAAEKGAAIKVWPVTPVGMLSVDDLQGLLSARTKIVAVAHVSNVLGTINDVAGIVRAVRAYNPDIAVMVDGAQGVVHGAVNVAQMDSDFYAFTGHKLYGPTGVGVLYGKMDRLRAMSPWQGGGDMIERVVLPMGTTFRGPPHRFEAGTPAIVEVIGLGAAIDYLTAIGMSEITAHEARVSAAMADMLARVPGVQVWGAPKNRVGIFSMTFDWGHVSDIAMILDKMGVAVRVGHHCAMPLMETLGVDATLRVSLAMYSDMDDVARLEQALISAREMLT